MRNFTILRHKHSLGFLFFKGNFVYLICGNIFVKQDLKVGSFYNCHNLCTVFYKIPLV